MPRLYWSKAIREGNLRERERDEVRPVLKFVITGYLLTYVRWRYWWHQVQPMSVDHLCPAQLLIQNSTCSWHKATGRESIITYKKFHTCRCIDNRSKFNGNTIIYQWQGQLSHLLVRGLSDKTHWKLHNLYKQTIIQYKATRTLYCSWQPRFFNKEKILTTSRW